MVSKERQRHKSHIANGCEVWPAWQSTHYQSLQKSLLEYWSSVFILPFNIFQISVSWYFLSQSQIVWDLKFRIYNDLHKDSLHEIQCLKITAASCGQGFKTLRPGGCSGLGYTLGAFNTQKSNRLKTILVNICVYIYCIHIVYILGS